MPKNPKSFFAPMRLKAQSNRNLFDRSFKHSSTAALGLLLPCGSWRVNANDFVEIDNNVQVVSPQLARPAFARLKHHVDYFFVPYVQLYMPFDNLITGQNRFISSAVADVNRPAAGGVPQVANSVPMMSYDFLHQVLTSLAGTNDILGYDKQDNAIRLLDLLGYGDFRSFVIDSGTTVEEIGFQNLPDMNPFNLLAYQKIYFDYYSNRSYESFNPQACNMDKIPAGTRLSHQDINPAQGETYLHWFDLHYRWIRDDYFTSVMPNTLPYQTTIGFEGIANGFPEGAQNFGIPGFSGTLAIQNGSSANTPNNNGLTVANGRSSAAGSNNITALRFGFAYDKFMRRSRYAGADYDKQMLAHFGITPYDGRHGDVMHLGGFVTRVNIDTVTDTSSSQLGNMGAQINAYRQSNHTIKFHAKEPGIIMAIQSFSIDNEYQSNRIDRSNTACTRFDWYFPAFENLGLQPIFKFELQSNDSETVSSQLRSIMGYQKRYAEYKTHVDECHGVLSRFHNKAGDKSAWVATYELINGSSRTAALNQRDLVIDPAFFNQISNQVYDATQANDPFISVMYHRFKCISNMSVNGEFF